MNSFRRCLCALVFTLPLVAGPAIAGDDHRENDEIVLQLVEESWVETKSARVILQLKALLTDGDDSKATLDPNTLFGEVAMAAWQITRFQRGQTDTGFEQWVILAEARLPQSALTGIYDRVKDTSSRGRTMRVVGVDFTPSLAERQVTAAKLRAVIYQHAADEAAQVAKVLPGRGFRVHQVDFAHGGMPQPIRVRSQARETKAYAAQAIQADTGGNGSVAERLVMSATVVIAADPKAE
jgi:hypothetical protein